MEEPVPSPAPLMQYLVMGLASKHVKVTLDGQGADELLAGYDYFECVWLKEQIKYKRYHNAFKYLINVGGNTRNLLIKHIVYMFLPKSLRNKVRERYISFLSNDLYNRYELDVVFEDLFYSNSIKKACTTHINHKLEHLLKWEDKNSMRFGIEGRVPFLDHNLVEYALSINNNKIIKYNSKKIILKESLKNLLPNKIYNRTDKIGFGSPFNKWIKTKKFRDYTKEIVNDYNCSNVNNYYDKNKILRIIKKRNITLLESKEIWKYINLIILENKFNSL